MKENDSIPPKSEQSGPTPLGWVLIAIVTIVLGSGIWGNTEAMSGFQLVLSLVAAFFITMLLWGVAKAGIDKQEATMEAKEYFTRKNSEESLPSIQCGKCGHINQPGAKFCAECGNTLSKIST